MTENWDNFDTPQEKAERQAREKREEQARIEERAKNEQRDLLRIIAYTATDLGRPPVEPAESFHPCVKK
jgi:hypothetical protein